MKDINDNTKKKLIIYLIGNKIDLIDDKKVDFAESLEMATKYGVKNIEVSCKLDINITDTLTKISQDIYNNAEGSDKLNYSKLYNSKDKDENKATSCCGGTVK